MKRSLRSWLWSVPLDEEVDEELAFHREMRARERRATGIDSHVRDTLMTIGRKRDREMRVTQWLEEFRTDVAFALRQMRRAPGFTAVAVLTLALGIGANSAIFALVDATVLRALPFHEPDRLVTIWDTTDRSPRGVASPLDMLDWLGRSQSFAQIGGFVPGIGSMVVHAAIHKDFPVIQGVVLALVMIVIGLNLLIDVLYTVFDPRVGRR